MEQLVFPGDTIRFKSKEDLIEFFKYNPGGNSVYESRIISEAGNVYTVSSVDFVKRTFSEKHYQLYLKEIPNQNLCVYQDYVDVICNSTLNDNIPDLFGDNTYE